MPSGSVENANEIWLNSNKYRITKPVEVALASVYPEKQIFGDYTKDSEPNVSTWAMSDWRGGLGLQRYTDPPATNRSWYSTCQTRYNRHLTLPWLLNTTAEANIAGVDFFWDIGVLPSTSTNLIYCFGNDTNIYSYNISGNSWSAALHNAAGGAADSLTCLLNGTKYLIFARQAFGITYFDGTTWTNNAQAARRLAFWNNNLWGITPAGQLWYSTNLSTFTNDAILPGADGVNVLPNSLFVGPDVNGEPILYCGANNGLWAHDFINSRFVAVGPQIPGGVNGGWHANEWGGDIYFPSEDTLFQYNPRGATPFTPISPNKDDGLPSGYAGGYIDQCVRSVSDLLVGHTADLAVAGASRVPAILSWDNRGWSVVAELSGSYGMMRVFYIGSTYRVWYASYLGGHDRLQYITLPTSLTSPSELTTLPYATAGTHDTPWFSAGQESVDKLALRLVVETAPVGSTAATTSETATISYGLDYSATWTQLGSAIQVTAYAKTTFDFPNSTDPTGTAFKAIRFRVALARGTTGSNPALKSPDVISLTLSYRKKLTTKWRFGVQIDVNAEYDGASPKQQRANLVTAIKSNPRVEFTFRDETDNTLNYFVDVRTARGLEFTGHDEGGIIDLVLEEP